MTPADPLKVAVAVASVLDELRIRYVIGGSVASSVFGEPRSTLDLDLMIECTPEVAQRLARRLAEFCYVDEETAMEAAQLRRSFNAIHLATSLKIDFFFAEDAVFARRALEDGRTILIDAQPLRFYAPEDLIVRKLLWFRASHKASERQWRDVIGMLRASRDSLDFARLRERAHDARVDDLLDRVSQASGL